MTVSGTAVAAAPEVTNDWALDVDRPSDSSPAIAPDGTIYFGTFAGTLWAVNPDGSRNWTFKTGTEIKSSPAVGTDGTIYFGGRDRKFYAVRPDAGIASNAEVDRTGVRIAVGKGAAYDLFLTRSLKHATLVRGEHSFETFLRDKLEVVAGVKQAVVRFVTAHPEVRLLDGRFMEIAQAMCLPKGRPNAASYLAAFVEEMKASGFVAAAIARAKQEATVAPPAN